MGADKASMAISAAGRFSRHRDLALVHGRAFSGGGAGGAVELWTGDCDDATSQGLTTFSLPIEVSLFFAARPSPRGRGVGGGFGRAGWLIGTPPFTDRDFRRRHVPS